MLCTLKSNLMVGRREPLKLLLLGNRSISNLFVFVITARSEIRIKFTRVDFRGPGLFSFVSRSSSHVI